MSEHRTPFTAHHQVTVNSQYNHHPGSPIQVGTPAYKYMILDLVSNTQEKSKPSRLNAGLTKPSNILVNLHKESVLEF